MSLKLFEIVVLLMLFNDIITMNPSDVKEE